MTEKLVYTPQAHAWSNLASFRDTPQRNAWPDNSLSKETVSSFRTLGRDLTGAANWKTVDTPCLRWMKNSPNMMVVPAASNQSLTLQQIGWVPFGRLQQSNTSCQPWQKKKRTTNILALKCPVSEIHTTQRSDRQKGPPSNDAWVSKRAEPCIESHT